MSNLVKRLLKLIDNARRLHCFDNAGEPAEIDKDHARRVEEARLNALARLELGCDGWRQDVQEQSLRFTFLGDRLIARQLQLAQHLVALDQLPAQFQVHHSLP